MIEILAQRGVDIFADVQLTFGVIKQLGCGSAELERGLAASIYHQESSLELKQSILLILHELQCRQAISSKDYNSILCDLDLYEVCISHR